MVDDQTGPAPSRLRLTARLAIALFVLLTAFGLVLILYLVPRVSKSISSHGDMLLSEGSSTMHVLAERQTAEVSRVLVDLIGHSASARQRILRDLPLELLSGDVAAIRAEIEGEDARRSERQKKNVQLLAREMVQRADADITAQLARMKAHHLELTDALAMDLRTTHLILVGAVLVILLLVLGLGVHRFVVQPTRRLQQAARRLAAGNLDAPLPKPAGGELGDLARDFAVMVHQLKDSRAELQRLAANLELEVARKTSHLAKALEDLRNTHQQLAQSERLAALGTLAGGIAHEFHNVIGGIRGCAAELQAEETVADRRETLAVIQRAADRATGIVQQLLRFARRSVEVEQEVHLKDVVEDALRLCEPAARRQRVEVERSLEEGVLAVGDADGLHQVLVNLMTNALLAMPDGGTLTVVLTGNQEQSRIEVRDTGTGIDPNDLPHIFEPFFTTRGHEPTQKGTGLGLSVSYGIVTAHGGRITVASTPGAGATFTVILPRGSQPVPGPGR